MKYWNNVLALVAIFLMPGFLSAQDDEEVYSENLVENGSFELAEVEEVKKFEMIENAEGWRSATYEKADLFSESAKGSSQSIPDNAYGSQATVDGSNYAGFRAYTKDAKKPRTYLTTSLTEQMERNKTYCIKMQVSLADYSRYAVNGIGIYVSKTRVQKGDSKTLVKSDFQIRTVLNKPIKDREGWVTVCGSYTAKGGEGAIIIGCFEKDADLNIQKMDKPEGAESQNLDAYYYLENVEVVKVESATACVCGDEEVKDEVLFSPPYVNFEELTSEEKVANSTVYFAQESSKISALAKRDLKRFGEFLLANPSLKMEVIGHMDLNEFDESRVKTRLSNIGEKRAQSVIDFLVEMGVDASRFTIKDKAASSPISKYKTPMQLAKNRRVQFVVK